MSKLLEVLGQLVDQGNTVIVIEHNLDVIRSADCVIDLGPEGGDAGGRVVAIGTPEDVAREPGSHTGVFLAEGHGTWSGPARTPNGCGLGATLCQRGDVVRMPHRVVFQVFHYG